MSEKNNEIIERCDFTIIGKVSEVGDAQSGISATGKKWSKCNIVLELATKQVFQVTFWNAAALASNELKYGYKIGLTGYLSGKENKGFYNIQLNGKSYIILDAKSSQVFAEAEDIIF